MWVRKRGFITLSLKRLRKTRRQTRLSRGGGWAPSAKRPSLGGKVDPSAHRRRELYSDLSLREQGGEVICRGSDRRTEEDLHQSSNWEANARPPLEGKKKRSPLQGAAGGGRHESSPCRNTTANNRPQKGGEDEKKRMGSFVSGREEITHPQKGRPSREVLIPQILYKGSRVLIPLNWRD